MQSFDDDPDFGGSQDGSSEDDQNYQAEEAEEDAEAEEEGDADEDDDGDGDSDDNNEGDDSMVLDNLQTTSVDQKSKTSTQAGPIPTSLGQTPNLAPTSQSGPMVPLPERPPQSGPSNTQLGSLYPTIRPEALSASVYDIVPTIAAPQSTSINTVTATPDFRWVFSGGSDGYIRKFNWVDTVNGKLMLTVAQRHPFVESVVKAGVLSSYWGNEEPTTEAGEYGSALSPVYSLAVHRQALWLLSGLESGGINLQSVRHEEGKRIHCLRKHTSAVSVLNLAQDGKSVLSGSWDKTVLDWDLNTGQARRSFDGGAGQISAIEMRPISSLPVPETAKDNFFESHTLASDTANQPKTNGTHTDGNEAVINADNQQDGLPVSTPSPTDSLFGGNDNDSLFSDHADDGLGNGGGPSFGDDYDDEFTRAINSGIQQNADDDATADVNMMNANGTEGDPFLNGLLEPKPTENGPMNTNGSQTPTDPVPAVSNGLPHAEDTEMQDVLKSEAKGATDDDQPLADTVFLASSINGSLRIWDKRKPTAVAKLLAKNVPPWCMGACWSPDGNFIYAGRRNGTVEEFSLHKGLRGAERTFRFPQGSGPVSAVRAMPNGKHLVCASYDILRLYDLQQSQTSKHSTVPFLIVPGHRTGVISQLYLDVTCRFMISAAGNRGWEGNSTQVLLGYEVNI